MFSHTLNSLLATHLVLASISPFRRLLRGNELTWQVVVEAGHVDRQPTVLVREGGHLGICRDEHLANPKAAEKNRKRSVRCSKERELRDQHRENSRQTA